MKGITHFSVGIAFASLFREAVRAGADGNPLYFILGGVFGLLPDTLDFKMYKFLYKRHMEIMPDPNNPDPQVVADGVACAVNRAIETGEPVRIKLDTMRLGNDLWRQYKVRFDGPGRKVVVEIGPVVRMDQEPVAGSVPAGIKEASAPIACGIKLDYEAVTTIDILDGPLFEMVPLKDGRVMPVFIAWHRKWSHSLFVALLFAVPGSLIWGWLAGVVIFGSYGLHILLDHLGFMGCDIFYPFRRSRRTGGLNLVHSMDALPNFMTVWISCLVIFWNLYRSTDWKIPLFNPLKLAFYGVVLPLGLFLLVRRWRRGGKSADSKI
jgi:membrane-bound metal-dependent hydrolase YbcI (DUF457 family)